MEPGNPWLLVGIGLLSFVLAFIGSAVGLILGHLRLPLLVAYFGAPGTGAMTNLIISGTGAVAGAWSHVRAGRVSWKGVALIGIPSGVGAIVGVLLFVQLNPVWSYLAIGVMLIISGVSLVRRKTDEAPSEESVHPWKRFALETAIGLGLGALAAITGLMLGSLRLPMMIRYLKMDPKEAVGTNMVVGCLTALVGSVTGWLAGDGRMPWLVMAVVAPPTILGSWLGAWLTGRISKQAVQKFAGAVVAVTGVLLVGQGVVGTAKKPESALPPIVEEWDYDDWFDFDIEFPPETPPPPVSMPDDPEVLPEEATEPIPAVPDPRMAERNVMP